MAHQNIPNTATIRTIYDVHGEFCENVFYVQFPQAPTAAQLDAMISVFEDWHNTDLAPHQSANAVLRTIVARSEVAAEAPETERGITVNGQGDLAESAMPNNVTLAIKLTAGLSGRSARGRSYFIGMPSNAVVGDEVTLLFRDTILNAYQALKTKVAVAGAQWVIVSKVSGKGPDGKPLKRTEGRPLVITGISADTYLDSQRRRLKGRGM